MKLLISKVSEIQNDIWQKHKFKLNKKTSLPVNERLVMLQEGA